VGAALVVLLEDKLASSGFEGVGIITGAIFVAVVLAFHHGIWGTARNAVNAQLRKRRRARSS
jgi:branched-chain amino acid transport system permease protein